MSNKVKIGDKEYVIKYLKLGEAKNIMKAKKEKKLDDLDYNSYILAEAINKSNSDAKMTIEKFDNLMDIVEFGEIQKKILEYSGLDKYFKVGIGKK